MAHAWKSTGQKRSIWWYYQPSDVMIKYLEDMRDALRVGLLKAEEMRRLNGKVPSPIDLRRELKPWFDSTYDYARHHINPVCKTSIAILRSFRKTIARRKSGKPKELPAVNKLAMRIDYMLFRVFDDCIRVTLSPG